MLRALRAGGFKPLSERVERREAMRQAIARQPWDVVLSDYSRPRFDAPAALALLQEHAVAVPFIVVSGSVGEDTAVAAMKAGATDYVMKDRMQRLAPPPGRGGGGGGGGGGGRGGGGKRRVLGGDAGGGGRGGGGGGGRHQ